MRGRLLGIPPLGYAAMVFDSIIDGDFGQAAAFLDRFSTEAPGLSERKALEVSRFDRRARGTIARDGGVIVGYAHMSPRSDAATTAPSHAAAEWAVEIVVDPDHDEAEVVRGLLAAIEAEVGDSSVAMWSSRPTQWTVLESLGWVETRRVWRLRRDLPPDAQPVVPDNIVIRPFRLGVDEDDWLEVNNAAFAGHPEQGGWDRTDLESRMALPWFDPAGFHIAWRLPTPGQASADETPQHEIAGPEMVGYCWTKVSDGRGEIYVIGLRPGAGGSGLGTALTLYALRQMHEEGVRTAQLYVDGDNAGAVRMYRKLGFETESVNRLFGKDQPNR